MLPCLDENENVGWSQSHSSLKGNIWLNMPLRTPTKTHNHHNYQHDYDSEQRNVATIIIITIAILFLAINIYNMLPPSFCLACYTSLSLSLSVSVSTYLRLTLCLAVSYLSLLGAWLVKWSLSLPSVRKVVGSTPSLAAILRDLGQVLHP